MKKIIVIQSMFFLVACSPMEVKQPLEIKQPVQVEMKTPIGYQRIELFRSWCPVNKVKEIINGPAVITGCSMKIRILIGDNTRQDTFYIEPNKHLAITIPAGENCNFDNKRCSIFGYYLK